MVKKQVNRQEAEKILYSTYYNKNVSFEYPGYKTIYGKMNNIALETSGREPQVIMHINEGRYTCSVEQLKNCLKLL